MQYRTDIDGLRAIAVLPVILFHAGISLFSGGFIGVDVFFVISGFLISSLIMEDLEAGRFSLAMFYERRARRILPALCLVAFACIPFAWLLLFRQDMENFSQSLISVGTFTSNFLFWRESGYFDLSADMKPLLHSWSLAVEEQFYILFPLLLLALWRFGTSLVTIVLCILFGLSFSLTVWGGLDRDLLFYLLPTRIWELLLGVFVALTLRQRSRAFPITIWSQILSGLGLGLIGLPVFLYSGTTPFPSLYALLPTVGTALVLIFSMKGTLTHKVLSAKPLVWVGLISYSLYLWHQPILAFAKHGRVAELEGIFLGICLLLCFPLSYLSWRFIETPFRDRKKLSRGTVIVSCSLMLGGLIAFGSWGYFTNGFENRAHIQTAKIDIETVENSYCHTEGWRSPKRLAKGDFCRLGSGNPTIALIGDSHAGAIFNAMDIEAKKNDLGLWVASEGFCPMVSGFVLTDYDRGCANYSREVLYQIQNNPDIKSVVFFAQWSNYTNGYRDDERPSGVTLNGEIFSDLAANPVLFEKTLIETLQSLKNADKHIIILTPTPEFNLAVMPDLQKHRLLKETPDPVRFQISQGNRDITRIFSKLDGIDLMDVHSLFCDGSVCEALSDAGVPLFNDTNHVNRLGAERIVQSLIPYLKTVPK